jgi:Tfp pilus assembly protein PilN
MVFEINLLPAKYRKKVLTLRLDARVLAVMGAVVVIGGLGYLTVGQGRTIADLEQQYEELIIRKAQLEPQAVRVDRVRTQIRELEERIRTLEGLGGRNTVQLRILAIVSAQMPNNVALLELNQTPPAGVRPGTPGDRVVNLRGHALRKEEITDFILKLQSQELIEQVDTNFLRPAQVAGENVFEFSLTATLNITG